MSTNNDALKWHEKFLENLKAILQRVFNKYPKNKELIELSENKSKSYDSNGNRTAEAISALDDFNSYLENNPIVPSALEEDSPALTESISAAYSMIEERQKLMEKYTNEKNSKEEFDGINWLQNEVPAEKLSAARQRVKKELENDFNSTLQNYGTNHTK